MTTQQPRTTGPPRILAVEDEPTIRRYYERFGAAYGYEIVLAPTGTAALRMLQAGDDFDVILLDVRLPGVSGRALWKMMQISRPELCPRVLMVTADIMSESTVQLIEESGCAFLEKPFATGELCEAILRILRSSQSDPGKDHYVGGA